MGAAPQAKPVPLQVTVGDNLKRHRTWDLDAEAVRQVLSNLVRNGVHAVLAREDRESQQGVEVKAERGPDWLENRRTRRRRGHSRGPARVYL